MIGIEERAHEVEKAESRLEDIRRLEELWAASSEPSSVARPRRRRSLARVLTLGWLVFLATLFVLPPPPDPTVTTPLWADLLAAGMFLSLFATLSGLASPRLGYAASTLAAVCGTALAIGCFKTGHHSGFWPSYELAGFALLVGGSIAWFVRAGRRQR